MSPTEKNKFIRLMNPNYQFTQLQVMNEYLNELNQKANTIKDMVEANQIALAPEGSVTKLERIQNKNTSQKVIRSSQPANQQSKQLSLQAAGSAQAPPQQQQPLSPTGQLLPQQSISLSD
ncbi:hypothetical protein FGO68_gene5918 [Halteria grandinella]|uniref:Uncharacterized protein n=1 Tax=Halteria grandinella TaxID=5974 RepID=A0A8J8NBD0_HALGN|nr:hypothetical protein FGO68_gene5918 [Halteria grandinella]